MLVIISVLFVVTVILLTQDIGHSEKEGEFVDGEEEVSQEVKEVDPAKDNDSSDGAVLVNGHDADEEWGPDSAEKPSA